MSIRAKLFDACAVALILGGTGVLTLLWDGNARAAAESSLLAGSTRYVAYFITRVGDCRSHVESIRTFDRSELRDRVRLGGVVLVGSGPALREAQGWLAREYPGVRVLHPRPHLRRYLRELGFMGRPRLVVLDRQVGAVRFATDAPITFEEQRATRRALIAAIAA